MRDSLIFVLLGKSGAGKTTFAKELSNKLGLKEVVSTTSRPPREGEKNGIDYFFKSEEEMKALLKEDRFVEFVTYNGWRYGVEKDVVNSIEGHCIVVLEPKGYIQFRKYYGDRVIPIYIDTSDKNRMLRSLHREVNPNCREISRRLLADSIDFKAIEEDLAIKHIDNNCTIYEEALLELMNFICIKIVVNGGQADGR